MKRFLFLWSSLLLGLVVFSYSIALSLFFSVWFLALIIPCIFVIIKLIHRIGIETKVLTQTQKSELSGSVYRQGYLALFASIWCACFITRHPYEQCIYATTFGIALFCFFGLCLALRNYLNSFNSLWKREKEKSGKTRSTTKSSKQIILFKKLKSMITTGLIGMQQNL